jgi:hypothetical protein
MASHYRRPENLANRVCYYHKIFLFYDNNHNVYVLLNDAVNCYVHITLAIEEIMIVGN